MTNLATHKTLSTPSVIPGPKPWQRKCCAGWTILWVGRSEPADNLLKKIVNLKELPCADLLTNILSQANTPFAVVLQGPSGIIAAVDQNRSFPVFYATNGERSAVSGKARAVAAHGRVCEVDQEAALDAALSGYVTGRNTLLKGMLQLLPGSYLIWPAGEQAPTIHHYFRYMPLPPIADDEDRLVDALAVATDKVIAQMVHDAGGRPIWVPLSGGLDSRLIAAKLREIGYPRIQTFSFGLPGNTEAQLAEIVAKRLELPWFFVPCRRHEMWPLFDSENRKNYWRFADGLSSLPNPHDFDVMLRLVDRGLIEHDAVLVNGQTGDFTSGGHLRFNVLDSDKSFVETADDLIDKHFDLWRSLKTPAVRRVLYNRIAKSVSFEGSMTEPRPAEEMAALCECWEHQERQAKYVINQQRAYEFLDIDWMLPFWDMNLVNFWRGVPFKYKLKQGLYKTYLKKWDYREVFSQFPDNVTAWGKGVEWFVLPLSSLAHKLIPVRYHRAIQKPISYFGRFGHHYSVFSWRDVFSMAGDIRSPISLYTRQWFNELGIPFGDNSNTGPVKLTGLSESAGTEGAAEYKSLGLGLNE